MGITVDRLLSISGSALSDNDPWLPEAFKARAPSVAAELIKFLKEKNGFYAFESALHVLLAGPVKDSMDLAAWNAEDCWKATYEGMADDGLFFAEDVFGGQFVLKADGVYSFDPETAEYQYLVGGLYGWAEALLADYNVLTGFPLAHEWQVTNGPIPKAKRLVPQIPFVCGGEFSTSNLLLMDATRGMRLRGSIATQIRDLPDGAPIEIEIVE